MTEDSLLKKFILIKLADYKEPKKKGVPRGQIIGFSRKKFHAALFMCTADSQKSIAKKVGVSHGLLLKWRTEEGFRRQSAQLIAEFVKVFLKHHKSSAGEFRDASQYSEALIMNIFLIVLRAQKKDSKLTISNLWPLFVIFRDLFYSAPLDKFQSFTNHMIMSLRLHFFEGLLEKIISGLSEVDKIPFEVFFGRFIEKYVPREMENLKKNEQKFLAERADSSPKLSRLSSVLSNCAAIFKDILHVAEGKIPDERSAKRAGQTEEVSEDVNNDVACADPELALGETRQFRKELTKLYYKLTEAHWTSGLCKDVQQILDADMTQICEWLRG